ncbi:MAG: hypothetical protein HY651_04310 [Acidobacteria bacterium]|nr:hypothetical protein [Acidobacteriota bacterium]
MSDERLSATARNLAKLISTLPKQLRDLLDLEVGALASLIRADDLDYQDRPDPLPDEYYDTLHNRVMKMSEGTLPPKGRWLSGYYFNSALLRLGASADKTVGILRSLERQTKDMDDQSKPLSHPLKLHAVLEECRLLKHDLAGLGQGRRVKFDEAVKALCDLVSVLEEQESLLCNSAAKFPRMQAGPRTRGKEQGR